MVEQKVLLRYHGIIVFSFKQTYHIHMLHTIYIICISICLSLAPKDLNIPGLLGENGLRLALATILNGKVGALAILCGICCGSWCTINMGTSLHAVVHPLGRDDLAYVDSANRMASRSFANIYRTICFFGATVN